MTIKQIIKVILFPIYSVASRKIGFSYFFKRNGEWMLHTRGVTVPVIAPSLASIEYFRHFVPGRGDLVFDVGGELGLEARQFSLIVGDEGKVLTFECLPGHLEILKKLADKRKNLQVVDKACWNKTDKLTFFEGHTAGSGSAVPDVKGQHGQDLANTETGALKVDAETLDSLWDQFAEKRPVNFLKMDIEGAEYEALEGASKMLKMTSRIVVAAYHIRDGVRTADKVAKMLRDAGFKVRIDENDHVYGERV